MVKQFFKLRKEKQRYHHIYKRISFDTRTVFWLNAFIEELQTLGNVHWKVLKIFRNTKSAIMVYILNIFKFCLH